MKNCFSLLLLFFMLGTLASGNTAAAQGTQAPDKASAQISKKMMQVLKLNEWEYIKVKEMNHARINQMTEALTMYSHDPAGLETRLKAIEKEFETGLAAILKKETFEGYASFKMTPEGDVLAMVRKTPAPAPVK